jgi:pectate lyase
MLRLLRAAAVLALLLTFLTFYRAKAAPADGPIGFASVSALGQSGTTGGAGGPVVTVTSAAELIDYISRTGPYVIQVSGAIALPAGAAKGMYNVTSDKTIVGLGSTAAIVGGGFTIGDPISDITAPPAGAVHNIIIRNLTFTGALDDAINVQMFAHHIWIDHNDLSNGYDGLVDIKRGADYITVSWNHTHDHSKNMLLGHDDNNGAQDIGRLKVTYHHNWFDRTPQRNPRVRFAEPVHVFNNYFVHNSDYGVASAENAGVVVEGNYFLDVEEPTVVNKFGAGRLIERNNVYAGESGAPESRGPVVEPGTYYRYTLDNPADIPAIVQAGAGVGKIGTTPPATSTPAPGTPTATPTPTPPPPADCVTAGAAQGWQNRGFAAQTGSFTAEFDATPSRTGYEALVGLSDGAKTSDSGFAAAVRFNTSGRIDARGQGSFTASNAVSYSANTTYHFRLAVDLPNHRYSVYVTPRGGAEQTVATNLAFRSEQSSVSTLDSRGAKVASSSGALTVCGLTVRP